MKTVKLFEVGEEVMISAKVTNVVVDNGEIKYKLKNIYTGRDYESLFTGDLLHPVPTNCRSYNTEKKGYYYKKAEGEKENN